MEPLTIAPPAAPAGGSAARSDLPFVVGLSVLGGSYVLLILALLAADLVHLREPHFLWDALRTPEIRHAITLSLITCTLTALLCLWVAVPLAYLMSRYRFPLKGCVDAIIDIPIVLPPLVIGLSLLMLFQTPLGRLIERHVAVTYAVPGIVLAQFAVACAFAVRTMLTTFDEIPPRQEEVALTLGCTRGQAFWRVALPQARRGLIAAATLSWARSLGEFGPILIFAGATRLRTEVLPTSVFLELSVGQVETALAVSLIMILAAAVVLVTLRGFGISPAHVRESRA